MYPVRVFVPRVVAVASSVGLWVALACAAGCQGPDEFFRSNDAAKPGTAGSGTTGSAGTTGVAGTTGTGGSGGSPTGLGGSNAGAGGGGGASSTGAAGSGTGTAGSGGSTTGAGGSMTGGTTGGAAGGGGSPTGAAGSGGGAGATSPRGGAGGGQAGSAGTTGTGGRAGGAGGTTGAAGSGTGGGQGGSTGTGGSAGGAGPNRLQVVALCQTATSLQEVKVTFKILNPDSVAKQWSDIKVRYYFTPTVQSAPMVTFDYAPGFPSAMITTKATPTYVEVGFASGSGTVAAFDNVTGSKEMQLRFYNYSSTTWNSSQADDYSYKSCAGAANMSAYTDRLTMPGYYQGQLAWGSEPPL